MALYPPPNTLPYLLQNPPGSRYKSAKEYTSTVAALDIYLQTMHVTRIQVSGIQEPPLLTISRHLKVDRAMPAFALFTNLGGSLGDTPLLFSHAIKSRRLAGLFLGISVFSMIEVLTLLIGCFCGFTGGKT